ncbi:MAG: hypothetical protein DBY09_01210 [Selenomonadales bacterium]|jgi:hypothetical protein|nr:hypothetical protein [Clostridiales bacterium]PWM00920.1 MAG: hypothetical protein DBY09_01210 [Selenomonadales bacterium]
MKKQLNADAYILGLELTVKTLSNRIKELEETLNNERAQSEKSAEAMKKRIAVLEADIKRGEIEKNAVRGNSI